MMNAGDNLTFSAVSQPDWPQALELLFATFPADEVPERVTSTLEAVSAGRLSLDGLCWARRAAEPIAAALWMTQPDGIALVWPPTLSTACRAESTVAETLLAHVIQRLDADGVRWSQVLSDSLDDIEQRRLEQAGYSRQADLFFLGRPTAEAIPDEPGLATVSLAECGDRARFERVLGETYQGTCDCPWLNDVRTPAAALACHEQSGVFDPTLWRVFVQDRRDAALALLADHPEQDALELMYFGVVPEFRGRGLGRRVLVEALRQASLRGRSVLFLAVDAQNRYAHALYGELGFREIARRRALFRCGPAAARK